jgi:hypothetical protein
MPDLVDPAEFGIAVQKWWYNIQPAFRKSDSPLPAAIFVNPNPASEDDWKELRKGGQNGIVSLLIMLFWWGKGQAKKSQWQDDSSIQWTAMIMDVSRCLEAIGSSIRQKGKKRKGEASKVSMKRYASSNSNIILTIDFSVVRVLVKQRLELVASHLPFNVLMM